MFEPHPAFTLPKDKKAKIWRYTNLPKFIWLIKNSSLYFTRADQLQDKHEGSLGKLGRESWESAFKDMSKEVRKKDFKNWDNLNKNMRSRIFINSWHAKEYESAAMWGLYSNVQNGLAIQSSVDRFIESLKQEKRRIYIGNIIYIDYITKAPNPWNAFNPFVHKLRDFEHENEIRAVVQYEVEDKHTLEIKKREIPRGISVSVDIDFLIEKVVLAPNTQPYFQEVITSLCDKYNKKITVEKSSQTTKPLY